MTLLTAPSAVRLASVRFLVGCLPHFSSSHKSGRQQRSFFYVPGDQERRISKMLKLSSSPATPPESIPDILVLDCEDAVSHANKEKARSTIASAFASGSIKKSLRAHQSVSLRINHPTTGLAVADLDKVLSKCIEATAATRSDQWLGPDLITIPKTDCIDELLWVEARILKLFKEASRPVPNISLVGMIESPLSVTHSVGREETDFPRRYMVTVCKAYGLAAVDMVETDLADMDTFRKNCEFGSQIGYSGKQLIHPKQVEDANVAFSPNPKLVAWATALVEAADKASASGALAAGAFTFEGHMIDRPTIRQAQRLVTMAKLVHSS
nr:unnamed protein product [Spirometra erinaceieuropaei]